MYKIKTKILFLLPIIFSFFICLPVLADDYTIGGATGNLGKVVNVNTGIEQRELLGASGYLVVIVKGLLGATGFVFFILMLYGGFLWMTARGDETKVDKGRDTIIQAVIGLAVIVAAYAITQAIINIALSGKTG